MFRLPSATRKERLRDNGTYGSAFVWMSKRYAFKHLQQIELECDGIGTGETYIIFHGKAILSVAWKFLK